MLLSNILMRFFDNISGGGMGLGCYTLTMAAEEIKIITVNVAIAIKNQ